MWEPSRIVITYSLILQDDLIDYVWKWSIEAAARAQEQGSGGGMLLRGWTNGPVTNIQFAAIETTTNGIDMTIVYTNNFTNRLDIFTCDSGGGLVDFWWDLAVTTNIDSTTNWIAWTDPDTTNSYPIFRFYAVATADVDSDGDGYSDARERYIYHTDPNNSTSKPVSVSGTTSYTGSLTGPVRMIAVTSSNSWSGCMATNFTLGAYTNSKVANGTSYWFKAYRDCNYNRTKDYGEPWGTYTDASILVTNNLSGINITMTDHDEDGDGLPDWWEMQHFGNLDQGPGDDPDLDGLSNLQEFQRGTDPLNPDTDGDGMGDGAEVANGLLPTSTNLYQRLPFADSFENYSSGIILAGTNGWDASPSNKVFVTNNMATSGTNAVVFLASDVPSSASHYIGAVTTTPVWIDCWVKLTPSNITYYGEHPGIADAPTWMPAVFSVNRSGKLYAYDGGSSTWVTDNSVVTTGAYCRFTVMEDFSAGTWSLYTNGVCGVTYTDLGFRTSDIVEFSRFGFYATRLGTTYLDNVTISTNSPW